MSKRAELIQHQRNVLEDIHIFSSLPNTITAMKSWACKHMDEVKTSYEIFVWKTLSEEITWVNVAYTRG
jgi:hypothetical protein